MGTKRKPLTQLSIEETQAVPTRKRTRIPNGENDNNNTRRRAGTINRMVLKNFMCHSLLEVDFSTNISMVIGKNGSGKSAILTALVVGLGGKASLTNRGSSIKGFVKAGRSSGTIEIQLCNEGPMAYRPNIYGNTITIIRNISASGSGSYRVKSQAGEVISTQAREVSNIVSGLSIQIDNPVCVLNQDTSRNFLSSKDPKNKFTLFMKATGLEMLEEEYKAILKNRRDSERIMDEKTANFKRLKDEIISLKRKISSHLSIVSLKDKKSFLQKELMWAYARDTEVDLEHEKAVERQLEEKVRDIRKNAENREEKVKNINDNIRDLQRQIAELNDQIEVQKRPLRDTHHQLEELQRNYAAKKREKQTMLATIEAKTTDATYLEEEISKASENLTQVEQQKMQRLKQLNTLQEKLKGFGDQLETYKNDLFQIKCDLNRKEDEEKSLRLEIAQIDQGIANEQSSLQAMQRESGNKLMLYGRSMPRVKQMIQQNIKKFKHEPRGPLGSYVKLKDKKWAVAVEGYLKGNLGAFAVDNKNDSQVLRQIFSNCWEGGVPPSIITSRFIFQKHDVGRNLVHAPDDCVSLYDAIGIEDPIVSNCFVDQNSIENILLIPDNERSMELMSDRRRVPQNCKQGITMNGDRYYPDPNYKTYASNYKRAHYLQVDTQEHLEYLQHKIESSQAKKSALQKQLQTLQKEMQQQNKRRNELEEKIKKVNFAKNTVRREYEELNSSAEPEVQNVQFLETELEDIKRTLNEKKASMGKITEEMKEIKTKMVEHETKLGKLKKASHSLQERIEPLQAQIKECETKQKELSTSEEFQQRRLAENLNKLDRAKMNVKERQAVLKKQTEEASAVGERLPEIRQAREINQELSEVSKSIGRIETTTENIGELTEKYNFLSEKYKAVAEVMNTLQRDVEDLKVAVDKRKKYYKMTENYFVAFIKISFKKVLEFRQFKGTIEINMNEKKLELIVIPQHGSQGLTNTSNLSGGERSFSTVAFLYALWQCMEFPFYFLDEFDVYMDKLNRTKVIDILLHHANQHPDLQFVFLTPQDVSFINQDVSVLKLDDPVRFNV